MPIPDAAVRRVCDPAPARARPPLARSSRVNSWASAPFLSTCRSRFDRASTCLSRVGSAVAGAVGSRVNCFTPARLDSGAAWIPAVFDGIPGWMRKLGGLTSPRSRLAECRATLNASPPRALALHARARWRWLGGSRAGRRDDCRGASHPPGSGSSYAASTLLYETAASRRPSGTKTSVCEFFT